MKKLILILCLCSSLWAGSFDYVINEGYYSDPILLENQSLQITGGEIARVNTRNNSLTEMTGGQIDSINFNPGNNAFNMSDGYVKNLIINGSCLATLEGGTIDKIELINMTNVSITFICDIDSVYKEYNEYGILTNVSGNWLDGSEFNTQLSFFNDESLIHFVPEPASMLLLGLGGMLLKKRKLTRL